MGGARVPPSGDRGRHVEQVAPQLHGPAAALPTQAARPTRARAKGGRTQEADRPLPGQQSGGRLDLRAS
eukprot:15476040-Alexandrium_andersonii.AAC.1